VDRRGSLRWKEFARIHIPLPPLDEQREISAVLDEAKREIALLQAKVEALKTQKRGLMQKLLTGQWRIPTHAGEPSYE
jgi:type I restriction enzyme S subunit